MPRQWTVLTAILMGLSNLFAQEDQETPERFTKAMEVVQKLATMVQAGNFKGAVGLFDPFLQGIISSETLKKSWEQVNSLGGSFKATGKAWYEMPLDLDEVPPLGTEASVTFQFRKAAFELRASVDETGRVRAFSFTPAHFGIDFTYLDPEGCGNLMMDRSTIEIGGKSVVVGFSIPTCNLKMGASLPAVVFLPDYRPWNGCNVPDESYKTGLSRMSSALVDQGVILVDLKKDEPFSLKDPLAPENEGLSDMKVLLKQISNLEIAGPLKITIGKVFLVAWGHSAILVPKLVSENPEIAGIIVLSGLARPLPDVLLSKGAYELSVEPQLTPEMMSSFEKFESTVSLAKNPELDSRTKPSDLPLGLPPEYWKSIQRYDINKEWSTVKIPVLFLRGGRDYVTTTEDEAIWKEILAGNPKAMIKVYPKADFRLNEGEGKPNPRQAKEDYWPSSLVVSDIAAWIKGKRLNPETFNLAFSLRREKIYIPKNLKECFEELKKRLDSKEIGDFKKSKDTSGYHRGLGMWMRNQWGLYADSRLATYFNQMGIFHPDDMSGIILDSFHRKLNGQPIRLEEQIEYYKEYWRKMHQEESAN